MLPRSRSVLLAVLLSAGVAACIPGYIPPAGGTSRPATAVAGSYDSTWAAVVSFFADRNYPIRTIEKASGIIVAEALRADMVNHEPLRDSTGKVRKKSAVVLMGPPIYADCGTYQGYDIDPRAASFNVRVLGDGTRSTVRVTTRYTSTYGSALLPADCTSTGKFEADLEAHVKRVVETGR